MHDEEKTKEQIIHELTEARSKNIELQQAVDMCNNVYQTVFDNAPIGMALADSTGELLIMNAALREVLGHSLEDRDKMNAMNIGGQPLQEILIDPPTSALWYEKKVEGNPPQYFEVLLQPVETVSNLGGRVLIFREATTELALQESEEKYRQLFSNELDAISIFNPANGQILDVNQAYLKLYGYSREEVLEMTVADVSAEPNETMRAVQDAITTQSARILVRWHKKKDGTVFPVELYAGTFEWKGQTVMCATLRDITERMEAERRRIELALERERVKILSSFVAQASHEFKTPLTAITTSAYLLRKSSDPDKRASYINQIELQVENTTSLVNTLTTMAKLDSGEPLVHAEVDLNEIIQRVTDTVQPMAREANHNIVLEIREEPLPLLGDSIYLQEAIGHILRNAIRYTRSGGTITVRSKCVDENAVIEISDTGIGMDEDTQRQIFKRFYRADVAGTTRGFGLGIPIAKAIIEEHEGKIEVESELGNGSTFTILLPITRNSFISSAAS